MFDRLTDTYSMKLNFSKRNTYLFAVFFLMVSSGFVFQNCSPALFNLQRGASARATEDVSDFLKNSEDEIKVTKEELKHQDVFVDDVSDSRRKLASENEAIIESSSGNSKVKIRLKKSKKK